VTIGDIRAFVTSMKEIWIFDRQVNQFVKLTAFGQV